jgi:hypothetical protein
VAKSNINASTKFKVLVKLAKPRRICRALVRGLLENLWDSAHVSGPYFESSADIETASEWEGKSKSWHEILLAQKWIDKLPDGRFRLHDYYDHCPDFVIKREARKRNIDYRGAREALAESYRIPSESNGVQRNISEVYQGNSIQGNSPKSEIPPESKIAGEAEFTKVATAYPGGKRNDRFHALRQWRADCIPVNEVPAILSAIEAWKIDPEWTENNGQHIPYLSKFIAEKRWLNPPSRASPVGSDYVREQKKRQAEEAKARAERRAELDKAYGLK